MAISTITGASTGSTGTVITTGSSGQVIPKAALPTGSVLQVVSTDYSTSQSFSVNASSAQTGCSVSITPTSSTSKILIIGRLSLTGNASYVGGGATIYRNSTLISQGTAGGTFNTTSGYINPQFLSGGDLHDCFTVPLTCLDSPATTSSITYYLGVSGISGVGTVYINRSQNGYTGFTSTITCMEIAA